MVEVDLFVPCFIDQFNPETAVHTLRVLKKLGVKVYYNPKQSCCGQFAFNSGYWDEAKKLGEKFISDFRGNRLIVSPSASCTGYVRNYFHELFHNSALHNDYRAMQTRVWEFSDFVVNYLKTDFSSYSFEAKVAFHDSCAALREYKLSHQPRTILGQVKGLELVELTHPDNCCGFGGTFSLKFAGISAAMAEQKIQDAQESGAEYLVSTDRSCLLQMQSYISKHKLPLKLLHLVDLLALAMGVAYKEVEKK